MSVTPNRRNAVVAALGALAIVVSAILALTWAGSAPSARTPGPTTSSLPGGPDRSPASALRSASPAPSSAPLEPGPSGPPTSPPGQIEHVWWIWMENREYGAIIGNARAAYINRLADRYGLATNYFAISHPSEPNYIAAVGGSTLGVVGDGVFDLPQRSLFDQLEAAGLSWHVYAQDYPDRCFTGRSNDGGKDGPGLAGTYVRRHNPAISFTRISRDPERCARITGLAGFDPSKANFALIVANLTNDMHDGSVAQGDAFLRAMVPLITRSPAFASGVLFITWDEGTTGLNGGGHVATLVIRPGLPVGLRSSARHDHYGLLRTVEEIFGLPCLRTACKRTPLAEFLPDSALPLP